MWTFLHTTKQVIWNFIYYVIETPIRFPGMSVCELGSNFRNFQNHSASHISRNLLASLKQQIKREYDRRRGLLQFLIQDRLSFITIHTWTKLSYILYELKKYSQLNWIMLPHWSITTWSNLIIHEKDNTFTLIGQCNHIKEPMV